MPYKCTINGATLRIYHFFSGLIFLLFCLISPSVDSQISQGGNPPSWKNSKITYNVSLISLPQIDVEALKAEDKQDQLLKDIPFRFAYGHQVNITTNNSGSWTYLANGDRVWMVEIESKGALSINLTFNDYHLPEGAELFIYSHDKKYKIGALTAFNNKDFRQLGTAPIPGDRVIVEYFEPKKSAFQGVLTIGTVAHAYRDIFKLAENFEKGFGDSGNCNNNVICPESNGWENQIRSVALITLGNGTRWCTGSLINNVTGDGTPYFLTANHCTEGQTVSTMVFIFNYQSDVCDPGGDGNDGQLSQSISGATLLAHTNSNGSANSTNPLHTDMALLLLSEPPPDNYQVFYNGWDRSGDIPDNTVGIHHPNGDVKKISFDDDSPGITGYFDVTGNGGGTTHWRIINWDDGTTEPGSSGSPLFNNTHQVIGQLHGGQASCSNNVNDYYGRLALSFQFIKEWLDPNNTGQLAILGFPEEGNLPIDPGIHPIDGIMKSYCNEHSISPKIVIENYGTTTLTELDLNYYLNGNKLGVYNWSGSLETFETEEIDFGDIPVDKSGKNNFSVDFEKAGDANPGNNQRFQDFYFNIIGTFMEVNLLTDSFAAETSWKVFAMDGFELANGSGYENNTLYKEQHCVPDTCILFVISDTFGDGICCDFGEGKYSLTLRDSAIVMASGAEFDFEDSTEVCIQDFRSALDPGDLARVFPNPTTDLLNIEFVKNDLEDVGIRMFTIMGQEIFNVTYHSPPEIIEINLKQYQHGLYILEFRSGDFKQTQKIIIQ